MPQRLAQQEKQELAWIRVAWLFVRLKKRPDVGVGSIELPADDSQSNLKGAGK
jgi:hypothetical protein